MSKKSSSSDFDEEATAVSCTVSAETKESVAAESENATVENTSAAKETTVADTSKAEVVEKTTDTKKTATAAKTAEKKYGLERFLQINPVSSYVESLLRALHKNDVMTKTEWLETIDAILSKKVR